MRCDLRVCVCACVCVCVRANTRVFGHLAAQTSARARARMQNAGSTKDAAAPAPSLMRDEKVFSNRSLAIQTNRRHCYSLSCTACSEPRISKDARLLECPTHEGRAFLRDERYGDSRLECPTHEGRAFDPCVRTAPPGRCLKKGGEGDNDGSERMACAW